MYGMCRIAAFLLLLGASLFFEPYAFAEDAQPRSSFSTYIRNVTGQNAVEKEDQVFEDFVQKLMFISLDDTDRSWGEKPINMALRQKYFTDEGWQDYQKFVEDAKAFLVRYSRKKDGIPQVKAALSYGAQKYDEEGGAEQTFSSRGVLTCRIRDDIEQCGTFQISLEFQKAGTHSAEAEEDTDLFDFKDEVEENLDEAPPDDSTGHAGDQDLGIHVGYRGPPIELMQWHVVFTDPAAKKGKIVFPVLGE